MPIATALLEQIRTNDPTLKSLNLKFENLNAHDVQQLVNALATNTNLTTLDLGGNQISDAGAKALAANVTLTTLDVEYNQISDAGAKALATNTTLTTLNVWGNQIGDEGAKALATNATLTTLYVGSNQIGDEGAKALATNVTLITLYVEHNQISDAGAKALATNTTLTTLNVCGNHIGDEGAKALATNATLNTLDVGDNQISAEGAKALAAYTTLNTLNVEHNQIGAEGAKAFEVNTTLTTLAVKYNSIGNEKEKQLQRVIACNNKNIIRRRDQFVQKLILLARDSVSTETQFVWASLPLELKLHIISLMDFHPTESIGKSAQQIKACAAFIFNNTSQLKESLAEANKTKQDFKIVEQIANRKSLFKFFPSLPQIKPITSTSNQQSNKNDSTKKMQKIF